MTYEQSRDELQTLVQVELSTLLSDPSPFVKRAILANIAVFCIFLGRSKTDEVLLSHMLTFLNDSDWLLRWEFFESVVGVAALIGEEGLEALILPLFLQALSGSSAQPLAYAPPSRLTREARLADPEESVLARVLASMKSLTELGMFSRIRLWEIAAACLGLFAHPNVWIRQSEDPQALSLPFEPLRLTGSESPRVDSLGWSARSDCQPPELHRRLVCPVPERQAASSIRDGYSHRDGLARRPPPLRAPPVPPSTRVL